jgi:SAM-dependent MidA family methyltransferase
LAAELLDALSTAGPLPRRYLILEPSPELAARQRQLLTARHPDLATRCVWLDRLPEHFAGVVIANEVLDAMPAHRFRVAADGGIEEIGVACDGDDFVETAMPASPTLAAAVAALQEEGLAAEPGYCSEISLRLGPWTRAVAEPLSAGLILVIDYGYPRRERYLAERDRGTLMCYSRHRAHGDPYREIGLQDITTHVDFTALAEAGQDAGLDLIGYTTQTSFLIGCGIDALITEAAGGDPMLMLELSAGAKQLLLPSRMGERFQVMGLGRRLSDVPEISGFGLRDLRERL